MYDGIMTSSKTSTYSGSHFARFVRIHKGIRILKLKNSSRLTMYVNFIKH
jgi:hypothetical protein